MKPTREEATDAVRTLLAWAGDDPNREGLRDTPDRVVRAYSEWFRGYNEDPHAYLSRVFEETEGYDEMVILTGIRVESYCEHHLAPVIGTAAVAYIPDKRVVGISKLARVVESYARRLQIQEKLTQQVALTIMGELKPLGVGVVIKAAHQCMTTRGVHKPGVAMTTSSLLGNFREAEVRSEFLSLVSQS